ncbi:hypothetical protein BCR42DRAFT_420777 [Absidia repens]|uniref:Uncharacterized protein n=1 Tax=Absidia repens TaxID=90262 RepID=A0A1X2I8S3_9FUNG|nr:hypothetical protein BCR42DRAFT_420777 [Absidia repens]
MSQSAITNLENKIKHLRNDIETTKRFFDQKMTLLLEQSDLLQRQLHLELQHQQELQLQQQEQGQETKREEQRQQTPLESRARDLIEPKHTIKKNKDGTPRTVHHVISHFREGLKSLLGKNNIETELEIFKREANKTVSEIKEDYPMYRKAAWREVPKHIRIQACYDFENCLSNQPHNIPINRAENMWMTSIIADYWANKRRKKDIQQRLEEDDDSFPEHD